MNVLYEYDDSSVSNSDTYIRKAARAIIFDESDNILLIKSKKYGDYKFPGGGVRKKEKLKDTLKREVLEETGRKVKNDTIKEYGITVEKHNSLFVENQTFRQESYYFLCNIDKKIIKRHLDLYEVEFGYEPVFVSLDEAIKQNESLKNVENLTWVKRELNVLKYIKEKGVN